ncbi:MAG TPA: IS200/IS605 family transposase [Gemmatimonadales bacterium]|nr:IS200/IS605 family transposase [Gemmatimonadales bacterium]
MRHRIFYHVVWTTQLRQPLIDAETARFLCATLRTLAKEHRSHILEIGMVRTHIHLLIRAEPLADLPKMVGRMKGVTSRVAKRDEICPLSWADGYDIETVSPADEQKIRHYLRAQPYRHPEEAIEGWDGDERAHGLTR